MFHKNEWNIEMYYLAPTLLGFTKQNTNCSPLSPTFHNHSTLWFKAKKGEKESVREIVCVTWQQWVRAVWSRLRSKPNHPPPPPSHTNNNKMKSSCITCCNKHQVSTRMEATSLNLQNLATMVYQHTTSYSNIYSTWPVKICHHCLSKGHPTARGTIVGLKVVCCQPVIMWFNQM